MKNTSIASNRRRWRSAAGLAAAAAVAAIAAGCGRNPRAEARSFAEQAAAWVIEEAAPLLPAGARVVVWAADPPPNMQGAAPRLGEAMAQAAARQGFDVRTEFAGWPETPLLDDAALADLSRRHAPLAAVFVMSGAVHFDAATPPDGGATKVVVFFTRSDERLARWVRAGRVAMAFQPAGDVRPDDTRPLRQRYEVLRGSISEARP